MTPSSPFHSWPKRVGTKPTTEPLLPIPSDTHQNMRGDVCTQPHSQHRRLTRWLGTPPNTPPPTSVKKEGGAPAERSDLRGQPGHTSRQERLKSSPHDTSTPFGYYRRQAVHGKRCYILLAGRENAHQASQPRNNDRRLRYARRATPPRARSQGEGAMPVVAHQRRLRTDLLASTRYDQKGSWEEKRGRGQCAT